MDILPILILIVLLIIVLALVIRYFYWQIDQEMKDLARLESDPAYRAARLARLDDEIAGRPADAPLRRRRADLRRMAGDHAGVSDDLRVYLESRPDDDAGWAELAEAHLEVGRPREALAAADRALEIDPGRLEYFPLCVKAAILARDFAGAQETLELWEQADADRLETEQERNAPRLVGEEPVPAFTGDPWLPVYRAALALAEGKTAEAEQEIREAGAVLQEISREEVAAHPVLAPVAGLLPARATSMEAS